MVQGNKAFLLMNVVNCERFGLSEGLFGCLVCMCLRR